MRPGTDKGGGTFELSRRGLRDAGLGNRSGSADTSWAMPALTRHGNRRPNPPAPRRFRAWRGSNAADDLICSVLRLVIAARAGCAVSSEVRPDLETMSFLHELGAIAAAGGDIRERVFA